MIVCFTCYTHARLTQDPVTNLISLVFNVVQFLIVRRVLQPNRGTLRR